MCRNYGQMVVELARVVPDGVVCFFVSYLFMDAVIAQWHAMGVLQDIMEHKLIFIETQDVVETTLALDNFRRACDCGRGAVFFSVARGKVAEGIDFDRHYGRCAQLLSEHGNALPARVCRSGPAAVICTSGGASLAGARAVSMAETLRRTSVSHLRACTLCNFVPALLQTRPDFGPKPRKLRCRAVVMIGVPYQYTQSRILQARLEYLEQTFQIKDKDFLAFDAVRQASQCVGRVIRSKADYGMMIFADKRYQRHDKRDKLPKWITAHLSAAHLDTSTDMMVHIAREFMRTMAQPLAPAAIGKALLSAEDLERRSAAAAPAARTAPIVAGPAMAAGAPRIVQSERGAGGREDGGAAPMELG